MVQGENNAYCKSLSSRMPNRMIRVRTRTSVVTDGLRRERARVVKLCDVSNRQSIRLRSSL